MALMHLASRWRGEIGASEPQFTVLTVDHGLRAESAEEAQWVAEQAHKLGLPCEILRWRPENRQTRIQAAARAARYNLMAEYALGHGLDALVTAHHLDDQAETLLMRLGRGSGLDGLAGIPARGRWAGVPVLRPFLDVPKARLVATLKEQGTDWLEDPSNDDARFERVRMRQAMDELEKLGIGADALARTARRLRRASEALDQAAGSFLETHANLDEAGYCRIDAAALAAAPEETALRALARAIQGVGGQLSPPRLAKLEALLQGLKVGTGDTATLGRCLISRENSSILILRETGRSSLEDMLLEPGDARLWDNRYRVSLGEASTAPVSVRALGKKGYGEVRARLKHPVTLPEHAAEGLVAFWRDGEVLAVPPLGFATQTAREAGCTAEFVHRGLFSSGC